MGLFYFDKRQFLYFIVIYGALFAVLILPGLFPTLSLSEAEAIRDNNNAVAQSATVTSIFNNNLAIAGFSIIPFGGWIFAFYILWQTGVVVSSYGYPWWFILSNPFAYVELAVISYMILRSVRLVHLFRQRKTRFTDLDGKTVVRRTTGVYHSMALTVAYSLIAATIILLVSAFIEFLMIRGAL
jgi:hypothetical protein